MCCWVGKTLLQLTGAARLPDTHLSHTCSLSHGETTIEKEREESRREWLAGSQDLYYFNQCSISLCVSHSHFYFLFSLSSVTVPSNHKYMQNLGLIRHPARWLHIKRHAAYATRIASSSTHTHTHTHQHSGSCGWLNQS